MTLTADAHRKRTIVVFKINIKQGKSSDVTSRRKKPVSLLLLLLLLLLLFLL